MAAKNDAIGTFTQLYHRIIDERPFVAILLTGHLAIEFLLRKLVSQYDPKLTLHADKLNHATLLDLSRQIDIIDEKQRQVLIKINRLRNKLAHKITYEPSIEELLEIWRHAADAFLDLTDGISQGIEALEAAENLASIEELWILSDLFVQISYDLHGLYADRGGDMENF